MQAHYTYIQENEESRKQRFLWQNPDFYNKQFELKMKPFAGFKLPGSRSQSVRKPIGHREIRVRPLRKPGLTAAEKKAKVKEEAAV